MLALQLRISVFVYGMPLEFKNVGIDFNFLAESMRVANSTTCPSGKTKPLLLPAVVLNGISFGRSIS
jgi:hypothetical protein